MPKKKKKKFAYTFYRYCQLEILPMPFSRVYHLNIFAIRQSNFLAWRNGFVKLYTVPSPSSAPENES